MTSSTLSAASSKVLTKEQKSLLDLFIELEAEEARREFLDTHAGLRQPQVISHLCDEVVHRARVNLHQAEGLAAAALLLAEGIDDDYCLGRSYRATANITYLKGNYKQALSSYQRALECFGRSEHEKEGAITRSSALHNLVFLGEYEKAFAWADSARQTFERLGDKLRLARLESNLGSILFRQDRWEEAANRFRAAYGVLLDVGEPQDVAIALRNMAVCHVSLNNFLQALELYSKARDYCEENSLPVLVGEIDYNIAYLHYLRGEYTRAIHLYNETRKRCHELGERYHMALCDLDQAEIYLELNLVGEAADLAQRAFAGFDELGMGYETAKALASLAIARSREGKAFLALELLGRAREMFVSEQNRVWPALVSLYQALVLYREGRLLEAARLARSALEGFCEPLLPTKAAMCEVLLARLHGENGEYQRAFEYCRSALERVQTLDVPALKHQLYFVLGQVEEAAGDVDAALSAFRRSQGNLERIRSHLQIEELKIAFPEDRLAVYESLVDLIARRETTVEEKRASFTYIERAKSRSLADLMAFRAPALAPKSEARSDQAEHVRKLREELNWYYRQIDLQEMRGDDRSLGEVAQLRDFSRRQEDSLLRTLRELQTTDQEFSSLQEAATVDIETIRSVMPNDTQLAEYYIARGTIYLCLLDSDDLDIVPVSVASRVRELHRSLQFQLSKFRLGREYVEEYSDAIYEATQSHLEALYTELIAPVLSRLSGRHLVIVPHGFLHYLPFHALFDGEEYLIDKFLISYAPSASAYYFCCVKEVRAAQRPLILGVSDGEESRVLDEARAVSEILSDAELLLGAEANEEALRNQGQASRIVHLATHSFSRRDNPMFSAIKLGSSELNLFDLYNLSLESEIVAVSGCGRGLRAGEDGDELVGLTRGLLYAGTRSVLATFWDVKDETTLFFMRAFYRSLGSECHKLQAVSHAMRETRSRYPHPFHWAPYMLVGAP